MTEAEWRIKLSERINKRLSEVNITQRELAKRAYLSEATISSYLSQKTTPRGSALCNIAKVLECDVGYLIDFGEMIVC